MDNKSKEGVGLAEPEGSELPLDTSKMSSGEREALEVAEAAREKSGRQDSFGRKLFMGEFDATMLFPFPEQNPEEKKIGDEYVAKIISFLKENLDPDEVDETRTIPETVMNGLKEMGAFAMRVPKKYNGLGFSQVNYNRVIMAVASYCGSTAVLLSAHQSIGVPKPLVMFGTEEQKQKYLPRFREGAISAFALTEPDVGSDPAKMEMFAELSEDGSEYTLNGLKLWCTNGPIADILVVMARTKAKIVNGKEKQQITAFIVEGNTPGIETLHRCDFMGIRGIQNGLLRFTNVKVPAENVIWGTGRGLALALATLNTGRLTLPAAGLGMAKQCLAVAREWGNERVQWGKPVGMHQEGQKKLAHISSTTFAMEAITWITSQWADEGTKDIRIEAAMAKLYCSEAAWDMGNILYQFRGGRGFEKATSLKARGEKPIPVERMIRDCRINTVIEGTSEIMHLFLAREALDPHLEKALPLLKKGPISDKFSAALNLAGFYAKWYAQRWFNDSYWKGFPGTGPFNKHFRYINRTANRLARTLFHNMAKYQDRLQEEQVLLSKLIDIGTELFAMAATCSFAKMKLEEGKDGCIEELCHYFCHEAKRRIDGHFGSLNSEPNKQMKSLSEKVLRGDVSWLEEGVIK